MAKRTARKKESKKQDLVPHPGGEPSLPADQLPALIAEAGAGAQFAYEEFLFGQIGNENTRAAYQRAIRRFLAWCEERSLPLQRVAPKDVGQYFADHPGSIATQKQHLAAVRHLFDTLVVRHAVVLNPALSVRGQRYEVIEGKTPEITVEQARTLLLSIDRSHVVGLRDYAAIAAMIYTAARVGAVAKLKRGNFRDSGEQWVLRFQEKGGKSREIPVRHDLQQYLADYINAAGLADAPSSSPLFRTAVRKEKRLTKTAMTPHNMCRMVKRRFRQAGLPDHLTAHSFRVTTITDLLEQGVPLEDVQHLAGHADPRTTRLYDRRQKRVTRNIVERISV
jgi:site-specific recombinase XerD